MCILLYVNYPLSEKSVLKSIQFRDNMQKFASHFMLFFFVAECLEITVWWGTSDFWSHGITAVEYWTYHDTFITP